MLQCPQKQTGAIKTDRVIQIDHRKIERRIVMSFVEFLKDMFQSAPSVVSISSDSSVFVSGESMVRVQR